MNKNIDGLDSRLEQKALEGKELAEQLDNQLRQLKRGNHVRVYLKLDK